MGKDSESFQLCAQYLGPLLGGYLLKFIEVTYGRLSIYGIEAIVGWGLETRLSLPQAVGKRPGAVWI